VRDLVHECAQDVLKGEKGVATERWHRESVSESMSK
jgi:hypothetical protein